MKDSIFNLEAQQLNTSSKIVVGLERISEAFKVLLWKQAKTLGLSPIQIQLLIFIAFHKYELCNVSHLAKEFNVTKATVSDAVKVLDKKGLIIKTHSSTDSRSYIITLSSKGKQIVNQTNSFADPIKSVLENVNKTDLDQLYGTLTQLIYGLNRSGILDVQRTCYGCQFYEKKERDHYCHLLKKKLFTNEIRLDCPEYNEKPTGNEAS
ncbi:MarR family transcriptional regulator [Fulvivirga sp. M361]|nr:MarR family transcriptional regulator [Fulvivirga sp. M361]